MHYGRPPHYEDFGLRPATEVEAFDGGLHLAQEVLEQIGRDRFGDLMTAALQIGGRTPESQGALYQPQRTAYAMLHLRAGFDEAELDTDIAMRHISGGIALTGAFSAWEMFRIAGKQQETSVLEGERIFEAADPHFLLQVTRDMFNGAVTEKLAWSQMRDQKEREWMLPAPLDQPASGFANVTAHVSVALANIRGAAILTEDHQEILGTYRHLRDTRREISGDKRTYRFVRGLVSALDNKAWTAAQEVIAEADADGLGVEVLTRVLWCNAIDETLSTMARLKEKRAVEERVEAKQEYMRLIDTFREPEISKAIHAIMRVQAPYLYEEDVSPFVDDASHRTEESQSFTVDTWVDEPLFPQGGREQSTVENQQDGTSRPSVPKAYVDRSRLAMLQRIRDTWTKGAESVGSLFEGKELRRYRAENGEIFTDQYFGVVLPIYDKDDNVTAHFMVAESAVAGRNVTIVYRSDIGGLPWQDVARMSKSEARNVKGVKFLTHTKVGNRTVTETTEEKIEYLFTCSSEEYLHGKFSGETAKGELYLALGKRAVTKEVVIEKDNR